MKRRFIEKELLIEMRSSQNKASQFKVVVEEGIIELA